MKDYVYNETRYKMLTKSNPEAAAKLLDFAQAEVVKNWKIYEQMAAFDYSQNGKEEAEEKSEN